MQQSYVERCPMCGKVKLMTWLINPTVNAAATVPPFCYPNLTTNASNIAPMPSLTVPPLASASGYVPQVYDMCICR